MSEVIDKKRERGNCSHGVQEKECLKKEREDRGNRARIVRALTGLKMADFAKKAGVSRGTLIGWENGKGGGLTESGARKITVASEDLNVFCNPLWIMHGVGKHPHLQDKSYQPDISQGGFYRDQAESVQDIKGGQYFEIPDSVNKEIESFKKLYPEAVFMQLADEAMQPLFAHGDMVGGSFLYGENIKKAVNKECIVKTKNNELLCRYLISRTSSGFCALGCLNFSIKTQPIILTDIEIIAAAPIVWIRRFL